MEGTGGGDGGGTGQSRHSHRRQPVRGAAIPQLPLVVEAPALDGATGRQRTRMQLFDLWVQHYSAIDDADKNLLPLRPVYFRAPRD